MTLRQPPAAPPTSAGIPGVPRDRDRVPLFGASFGDALARFFAKGFSFTGRASRSEYWWVALFVAVLTLIPTSMMVVFVVSRDVERANRYKLPSFARDATPPDDTVLLVASVLLCGIAVVTFIPSWALGCRRLHDADLSGRLLLLVFIPWFGPFVILVLMLQPTKPEGARFDP